jgi:hypothetical protein
LPLVETGDGSLQPMFELQADQRAELEKLRRRGQLDEYTVISVPHRAYTPAEDDLEGAALRYAGRAVATGGGHRHARGRAGVTEFPVTWTEEQILANILSVAREPDHVVHQPNQRWRVRGARDGVEIVVIVKNDGAIHSAWPLPGGPGVQQNPTWSISAEEMELARTMKRLPNCFADRLDAGDVDALNEMAEAGEWAEEIDSLIATLVAKQRPATILERHQLTELLSQLGMRGDELQNVPSENA